MAHPIEYDDVKSTISGDRDCSWVKQEFASINLNDNRLNRRLIKTAEALAASPTSPINEACGVWADAKGAYRMFDNKKLTATAILKPHKNATVERMIACKDTVLVVQDTVFVSHATHEHTHGIGPIGKDEKGRGLIMHDGLAFTTTGIPLGILSQRIWARKSVPDESHAEKIKRLQLTAIDEKESSKWLEALRDTVKRTPKGVRTVTIGDRESDFYEFLAEAKTLDAPFVIRAVWDRKLVPEDSDGFDSIIEAIAQTASAGTMIVNILGNGKRQARVATVEVRYRQVTIKPPPREGKAKITASTDPLPVTIVSVSEVNPPEGAEIITWVLLTNLPVTTFELAVEKVNWYTKRWGIETWHKVLKSGCKVEDCMLETADRLKRYLTIFSIIACRLMHITYLARIMPDVPCTAVLTEDQWQALHIRINKAIPPAEPATLRKAVRMIAGLGGFLGRKGDGEPGMTHMWRGWLRLEEDVEMLHAFQKMYPGIIDTG